MISFQSLGQALWGRREATAMTKPSHYVPLKLEDDHNEQYGTSVLPRRHRLADRWAMIFNATLFFLSVTCFVFAYKQSHRTYQWYLKQASAFSPVLNKIDLGEPVSRFEVNELFNRPYTIYRGAPSPEVDAAWESIAEIGIILISGKDVRQLGKDPTKTVKAPEHWGFGADAHLAQIDGQHQIHCLNVLRKWSHYDYYFRPKYGDDPGIIQNAHRDHCAMLLLQTLTCQTGLDTITHNWVDTQQYPVPDFNLNRKCKNHDKILDWQRQNKITMDQWDEIRPRPGDFILPLWPELVEINRLNALNGTN